MKGVGKSDNLERILARHKENDPPTPAEVERELRKPEVKAQFVKEFGGDISYERYIRWEKASARRLRKIHAETQRVIETALRDVKKGKK